MMPPFLRKINLTAHITSSVGWFGSVFVFLVLSIVGLTGQDTQMVSAAYLAMNVTAWFAILPMCLIGFTTGVLQALGTEWGLGTSQTPTYGNFHVYFAVEDEVNWPFSRRSGRLINAH